MNVGQGIDPFFKRFVDHISNIGKRGCNRVYVFGTGPSLEKAIERDWSDGYRIVCNTIVRDKKMWHHIDPDFIVAGDALYHFSDSDFAFNFRRDLKKRLTESPRVLFVYPYMFHNFIVREFVGFEDQLVPIPIGDQKEIDVDLSKDFKLPNLGNILNLLLLPLACTLSKNVFLWGFDGRAPTDKYFWSNSGKHTYGEDLEKMVKEHPAFFEKNVPKDDPNKYVLSVHGDLLDKLLTRAESVGFRFVMMHKSWTETLNKRFR